MTEVYPSSPPFRWEHEMQELALARLPKLLPSPTLPSFVVIEAQANVGVVDLLAVAFDDEALAHRNKGGLGPVTLPLRVRVLDTLSRLRPVRTETLARLAREAAAGVLHDDRGEAFARLGVDQATTSSGPTATSATAAAPPTCTASSATSHAGSPVPTAAGCFDSVPRAALKPSGSHVPRSSGGAER